MRVGGGCFFIIVVGYLVVTVSDDAVERVAHTTMVMFQLIGFIRRWVVIQTVVGALLFNFAFIV